MYKIGEFSQLGQVSTRMLRHYDKLGLLTPGQIDPFTGYRYYSIDQLGRLNRIIALKALGFSLEQVSDLLLQGESPPAKEMRGMLRLRQAEIEQELRQGRERLRQIEARLRQIEQEGQPPAYEIVVKGVPGCTLASVTAIVPTLDDMAGYCERLYHRLYADLSRHNIQPLQPEITLYHTDEYRETDLKVEIGLPIDPRHLKNDWSQAPFAVRSLAAVDQAAALIYEGSFANLTDAVLVLLAHVGRLGYRLDGPLRELHLSGPAHPDDRPDPAEVVLELQLPIGPAASPANL